MSTVVFPRGQAVAKHQGPEEFFEALRKARDKGRRPPDAPEGEPEPRPEPAEEPESDRTPPASSEPTPEETTAPQESQEHQPPDQQPGGRRPLSFFEETEPTVTVQRSTLIFAVLLALVLLFIAFALGRRSAPRPSPQTGTITRDRDGLIETTRPALPDQYRDKWAIHLTALDRTRRANSANARAYRDFVRQQADFLEEAGKDAFIISYGRQLFVCVGPFDDAEENPELDWMVDKVRELRYNGTALFARASVRPLPRRAKLFE